MFVADSFVVPFTVPVRREYRNAFVSWEIVRGATAVVGRFVARNVRRERFYAFARNFGAKVSAKQWREITREAPTSRESLENPRHSTRDGLVLGLSLSARSPENRGLARSRSDAIEKFSGVARRGVQRARKTHTFRRTWFHVAPRFSTRIRSDDVAAVKVVREKIADTGIRDGCREQWRDIVRWQYTGKKNDSKLQGSSEGSASSAKTYRVGTRYK